MDARNHAAHASSDTFGGAGTVSDGFGGRRESSGDGGGGCHPVVLCSAGDEHEDLLRHEMQMQMQMRMTVGKENKQGRGVR